jgi:hypothetical protein
LRYERFLRKVNFLPADRALRKMRQALEPLMLRQYAFNESVERVRVGMQSGL